VRLPRDSLSMGGSSHRADGALAELLRNARYEVIPTNTIEEKVLESVPKGVTIAVTASPAKGLDATMDLAERFAKHGYRVVPHISARLIADDVHLKEIVIRMRTAGVEDVFVPSGDADPPAGKYDAALPVLAELSSLGMPFPHVGITGYPESHPTIADDLLIQAMWDKRAYGTYIVSNLCFDPKALTDWIARVRRRHVTLPIQLGIAGPVDSIKLLSMATKIGVGQSVKFVATHRSWFMRLIRPGGYSPERLLQKIGEIVTAPESGVAGLHVFTFNQVGETEHWRQRLLERLGDS
jgi:methylenetetrahydrofolate reductase (NADPH)